MERKALPVKYFAHRGLYNNSGSAPENTMAAFDRAVKAGYGIELDVQLTKDEEVVVTHDFHLRRNCGIEGEVDQFTYEELQRFPVFHSKERIPLLEDVLKRIDGKVPLLVELKYKEGSRICEKASQLLDLYKGTYMIESFHPQVLLWYKQHRPQVARGQLSGLQSGSSQTHIFSFAVRVRTLQQSPLSLSSPNASSATVLAMVFAVR